MTAGRITYRARVPEGATAILVPGGLTAPDGTSRVLTVEGGSVREIRERATGQTALIITPDAGADTITVTWSSAPGADGYPEAIFHPAPSKFTRAAEALVAEVAGIAPGCTGPERAAAIACATAERFTYGHPEARFNDGLDAVPALGCGLAEGSCVDINTYFLAALRSAGLDAGYVTGYFFPKEKQGACLDGHCWVVTRIEGALQHWDIAHHLKLGTSEIAPALNPKPGWRVGCFHSMGLDFPDPGIIGLKALIEPLAITPVGIRGFDAPEIRWHAV